MKTKDDLMRALFFILCGLLVLSLILSISNIFFLVPSIIFLVLAITNVWFGSQNMDINRDVYVTDIFKELFY